MANRLVPYIQDDEKWTKHYVQQAMKQVHPDDMLKKCARSNDKVHPNLVLPTVQLIAQAESDMKREKSQVMEQHAPIKATPEFDHTHSPPQKSKGKRAASNRKGSSKPSKRSRKGDAFD